MLRCVVSYTVDTRSGMESREAFKNVMWVLVMRKKNTHHHVASTDILI